MEARRRLREADVIVANHDLVLADLAMGGGRILPKPEECFYVIDEAHGLPAKAFAAFASSHFVQAGVRGAEKLSALAVTLANTLGNELEIDYAQMREDALSLKDNLAEAYAFFASLVQLKPTQTVPRPKLIFERSWLPEGFFGTGERIIALTGKLSGSLGACAEFLSERLGAERVRRALFEKLLSEVGFQKGRIEGICETWTLLLMVPHEEAPPVAKWIEAVALQRAGPDYLVNASPVLASG
jgi:ATP-dependent DNA helicase DinG